MAKLQSRKLKTAEEMFDLLSEIDGSKFVTFCYIKEYPIRKTKRKGSYNPDALKQSLSTYQSNGDDYAYNQLSKFHSDDSMKSIPFGILQIIEYNMQWTTVEKYNQGYARYSQAKDEIDAKYGLKAREERGGYIGQQSFGKNGLGVGKTDPTRGKVFVPQNTFSSKILSNTLYAIDENGRNMGTVSPNLVGSLKNNSSSTDEDKLRQLGKTEEEIAQFTAEVKALKYSPRSFRADRVLYIVATINGEKVFFINDFLAKAITKTSKKKDGTYEEKEAVKIDHDFFMKMAQDKFNRAFKLAEEEERQRFIESCKKDFFDTFDKLLSSIQK